MIQPNGTFSDAAIEREGGKRREESETGPVLLCGLGSVASSL